MTTTIDGKPDPQHYYQAKDGTEHWAGANTVSSGHSQAWCSCGWATTPETGSIVQKIERLTAEARGHIASVRQGDIDHPGTGSVTFATTNGEPIPDPVAGQAVDSFAVINNRVYTPEQAKQLADWWAGTVGAADDARVAAEQAHLRDYTAARRAWLAAQDDYTQACRAEAEAHRMTEDAHAAAELAQVQFNAACKRTADAGAAMDNTRGHLQALAVSQPQQAGEQG